MARYRSILAALFITATSVPAMAAPTDADKATARTLFFSAAEASKAGDHKKAADLFDRSNRLYPAPTAALGLARALEATGKWVKATETYYAILRRRPEADEPAAFARATDAARAELRELEARMPKLVLIVEGAAPNAVTVTVDGTVVPTAALGVGRPTNPGPHRVEVAGQGYVATRRSLDLEAGKTVEVKLPVEAEVAPVAEAPAPAKKSTPPEKVEPAPVPSAPVPIEHSAHDGSALRISGFIVGAVGLGGFIGAAVTGGLYVAAEQTVQNECTPGPSGNLCSQAGLDAVQRGRSLEPINTAMLAVGSIGVATGVALLIAGYVGGDEEDVVLTPKVSPTEAGLGLHLRF